MSFGGPPPDNFGGPPGGPGAPPPGGYGGPPGGGFGGPPPGGGFGGPPPGGGFGGPPGGGPFGPPPGGPFGPPGPMVGSPMTAPTKSGSPLPIILGVGCAGLLVLGIIGGAAAFFVYNRPPPPPPSITSPATPAAPAGPAATAAAAAGDLRAELAELVTIKSKYGKSARFIGEIANTGTAPIGYPAAKVTFYDAEGTAVDSGTCASLARVLAAGDKVPCGFSIFKGLDFKTYKIELVPRAPLFHGQIADIDILDTKFVPRRGYQPDTLTGKLTNKSAFKAKSVWAIVSLYDANKKLVGTDNALVAGNDLDPGQSGLFSAKVYEVAGKPESYRVIAIGYGD